MGGGGVLLWGGEAVQGDGQGAVGLVGVEVGFGGADVSDEGAGFVVVVGVERFAHDPRQGGLGPIGEDFDGVDEVFAAGG